MLKKELRKLRTLNATKEMMQKAKADGEVTGDDGWRGKRKYDREYGVFMRVQQLNRIIKVALFDPDDMKKGTREPRYEIFLNPDGKEYITREFIGKERIETWKTSMIGNLEIGRKAQWNYFYYSKKECWCNSLGTATLHNVLGRGGNAYRCIQAWQQDIKDQKAAEKRARETAPWDEDMKLVPEITKGFDRWLKKKALDENFIFYKYTPKGVETGFCTYCGKEVPVKKPRHGRKGVCMRCRRKIKFEADGRRSKYLQTDYHGAYLVQKIKNGFVVRYFTVKACYGNRKENTDYYINELERILFTDEGVKEYDYKLYKNVETRWVKQQVPGHQDEWTEVKLPVYIQRGIKEIEQSVIPIIHKKEKKYDPVYLLRLERAYPEFEKLVKVGLERLAHELVENQIYNDWVVDTSQGELTKMLMIDKNRLKRLRDMDGNIQALAWMQIEKKNNTIYSDEMISGFSNAGIYPGDLDFISDRMSYQKIYNYMVKQWEAGPGLHQVKQTWEDYLEMAKKCKIDTSKEIFYKPKNLKIAHDEMVRILERGGIDEKAKELRKNFAKVDEVCSGLKKYEYQSGKFCVVAPEGIRDIVEEGVILHHCIHTCDIYFDRITRQESYLLFLRKSDNPDMPWYTLEIEPGGNIRQKRTTGDKQNEDLKEAVPFMKKWQKEITKRLTKEDKELAEQSDKARKENYKKIREEKKKVWHGVLAGRMLADVLEEDFMGVEG